MDIADIFDKASGKLPMVPKVVQELIASFQRNDVNIDEVVDMVAHDQVLTARVLRLANTARYGGGRKVGSLDDAVVRLGFDNLRVLVIASGVAGATVHIPGFDMKAFWTRSFALANTARLLAKVARMDPQLGYTCGLLANIGELVLHVALPEQAVQIDKLVEGGADRIATERMMLGMDLADVGAELARRWNFPDDIAEAIRYQHDPLLPELKTRYPALLGLTTFLVAGFVRQIGETEMTTLLPPRMVAALGVESHTLNAELPALREAALIHDDLF